MKKAFLWCGFLAVFSILLALVFSIFVDTHDDAAQLAASVTDWQNGLRIVRWSVIAALAVFWSEACEALARYKRLSAAQTERARAIRWRVIGSLIVFELLVIESLPAKFSGI